MRTDEQIANIRRVMGGMFGPIAVLMSDEQVESFANELQRRAYEADKSVYVWMTQIRLQIDDRDWSDIPYEPKMPSATISQMTKTCERMLTNYPYIQAIQISSEKESFILER